VEIDITDGVEKMSSEWKNIPENISEYQGYVYIITHKSTGKFYIGKKFYWSKVTLKPLKGKRNKRHSRRESDWKDYWGSSANLLADISAFGRDEFEREIIKSYKNKWDCAYYELKEQLKYDVLFNELAYNEILNVRLRKIK
jgi:hypothetical protein